MKIRSGFVSNSSSSSFMVISRPARLNEIDDLNVKLFLDEDIISPGEGRIYFRPDEKTIELIKRHPEKEWGDFVYEYLSASEEGRMSKREFLSMANRLPDLFDIRCFEIAQYEPSYNDIMEYSRDIFSGGDNENETRIR